MLTKRSQCCLQAGQITFQAFILAGILGLTLMGGLFGFSDDALMTMGATGDVAVLGKEYLLARYIMYAGN